MHYLSNIYELSEAGGCHNIINLHGSIYQNHCQKCGKKYSVDYIRQARKVPYCEACGGVIRPDVSFFGEMLDSEKLSRTLEEIEKSDVLLLLGTSLSSDVFRNYIKCFEGSKIVLIHNKEKLMDEKADLLIYDEPKNVLPKLVLKTGRKRLLSGHSSLFLALTQRAKSLIIIW